MIYINDWCLNEYVDNVDEKLFFHGESPEIMYEDVTIPGRSGKLHLDLHRFEEKTIDLPCWIRSDFKNRYRVLLNKLNALKGVITLRCTPAPEQWGDGFYNTVFKGKITTPTTGSFLRNGQFTLKFDVNPKYWLDEGQTASQQYIWVFSVDKQYFTMWRTPCFTYKTGDTFKIRASGTDLENAEADVLYRNRSDVGSISLMEGATTAWENGQFFDFTSLLANGDVFYIDMDQDRTWEIQTDSVTGEMLTFKTGGEVTMMNPTAWDAKPLIQINAQYDSYTSPPYFVQFVINGILVRATYAYIQEHSGLPLFIDCELQDCYYIDTNGNKQNANAYISLVDIATGNETTDFPVLVPGENTLDPQYGESLYYMPMSTWSIIPRWYIV